MAVDLTARYLGLTLKNPLIASASPLSDDLEMLKRLESAGVSACVMTSIFEEQIRHLSSQFRDSRTFQLLSVIKKLFTSHPNGPKTPQSGFPI